MDRVAAEAGQSRNEEWGVWCRSRGRAASSAVGHMSRCGIAGPRDETADGEVLLTVNCASIVPGTRQAARAAHLRVYGCRAQRRLPSMGSLDLKTLSSRID